MIVDASIVCKWLVNEPDSAEARELLLSGEELVAPDLVTAEVAQVLWRKARGREIDWTQARDCVGQLRRLFNEIVPVPSLVPLAFSIAEELQHGVYDCIYVALAEVRNTRFVTADGDLARKASRRGRSRVVLLKTALGDR